jgi:hypothetical protein
VRKPRVGVCAESDSFVGVASMRRLGSVVGVVGVAFDAERLKLEDAFRADESELTSEVRGEALGLRYLKALFERRRL